MENNPLIHHPQGTYSIYSYRPHLRIFQDKNAHKTVWAKRFVHNSCFHIIIQCQNNVNLLGWRNRIRFSVTKWNLRVSPPQTQNTIYSQIPDAQNSGRKLKMKTGQKPDIGSFPLVMWDTWNKNKKPKSCECKLWICAKHRGSWQISLVIWKTKKEQQQQNTKKKERFWLNNQDYGDASPMVCTEKLPRSFIVDIPNWWIKY